ncbi:GntR family transcriptional regulator [Aurantimonas sp. C2-3-R2]|nr:GntR family transcriptional regulator [Aurantimonas sp. C2-4-R8]
MLMELISAGVVERDHPLSERGLAEKLQLGRTPVREAIRDLARDGILRVVPGYGTVLRRLTIEDLREILEVRHALEGMACELAAQHGSTPELDGYSELFNKLKSEPSVSPTQIQAHNLDFHHAIFDAAGNRSLKEMYGNLRIRMQASMEITHNHDSDRIHQSVVEHLSIIAAITAREPEAARNAMRMHLANGYETRVRVLAGLPRQG